MKVANQNANYTNAYLNSLNFYSEKRGDGTLHFNNKRYSCLKSNDHTSSRKVDKLAKTNSYVIFNLQAKKEGGGFFGKGLPFLAVIAMPIPGVNVAVNAIVLTTVAVIAAVEINKQIKENKQAEEERKRADQAQNNTPAVVKPPFDGAELGDDPTKCPGPGFEWKGNGSPESGRGSWHNETSGETLHPDLNHAAPIKPHWDYTKENPGGKKKQYRLYIDGSWEEK